MSEEKDYGWCGTGYVMEMLSKRFSEMTMTPEERYQERLKDQELRNRDNERMAERAFALTIAAYK